jgi:hypothetical protein
MLRDTPEVGHKSLIRRQARDGVRWKVLQSGEGSRAAFRAREISLAMHSIAKNPEVPIPDRVAACKAMLAAQEQLMEWIGHPKRPAARSNERQMIPIEAIEATITPIPPDLPITPE